MADERLIASARLGDVEQALALLQNGADLHASDEHGWTALSWAAGGGHTELVRRLLERGANPLDTGTDQRTAYQIALAASHVETARVLAEAEVVSGGDGVAHSSGQAAERPYACAYTIRDLRRFPAWLESGDGEPLTDDSVVFVQRDGSVTRSMWAGEDVIFAGATAAWHSFCVEQLRFHPLGDFDWLPPTHEPWSPTP